MQITLEPGLEYRLRAIAEARGIVAEDYVKELIEERPSPFTIPDKEKSDTGQPDTALKPLIILEGSVPSLTKDDLY